jgi:curved DNA-binding protein CbpA
VAAPPPPIPGVASLDLSPVVNREFDPRDVGMTPEDYFVLTRVDGHTSFRQILLMVGFPEAQTLAILAKLRAAGAILLPGEPPPDPRRRVAVGTAPTPASNPPADPPPASTRPRRPTPAGPDGAVDRPERTPTPIPRRAKPVTIDPVALAEDVDLSDEQKRAILGKHALLTAGATLFEFLEVSPDADKKALKRHYFKFSKEFHPDRFFGKKLGSYQQRLAEIFKAATDAFAVLEDDEKRAAYIARLQALGAMLPAGHAGKLQPAQNPGPAPAPSRTDRAAELFDAACRNEVTGDLARALKEFDAAIQLDPLPRYLRRAALAFLRAQELRSAEEYAKKFAALSPRDAQAHRTLAKVFRALGRNSEALLELETATRLDPENVHIAAELDEVRRLTQS